MLTLKKILYFFSHIVQFKEVKPKKASPDFVCPNCNGMVKANASACPHCGSDNETGWKTNSAYSYISPEFDENDYRALSQSEFNTKRKKRLWDKIVTIVAALIIVLWIIYLFL